MFESLLCSKNTVAQYLDKRSDCIKGKFSIELKNVVFGSVFYTFWSVEEQAH